MQTFYSVSHPSDDPDYLRCFGVPTELETAPGGGSITTGLRSNKVSARE